jgi:hypothetical protein
MSNQALGTRPTDEPRQSKKAPTWAPLQDFFRKHDLAQCSKSGNKVVGTSYTPRPGAGLSCDRNPPRLRLKTGELVFCFSPVSRAGFRQSSLSISVITIPAIATRTRCSSTI